MSVFYNDNEPYAAQWLRNLIAAGHLPKGEVDERGIDLEFSITFLIGRKTWKAQ